MRRDDVRRSGKPLETAIKGQAVKGRQPPLATTAPPHSARNLARGVRLTVDLSDECEKRGWSCCPKADQQGGEWQRPLRRLAIPLGQLGLSPCPKVPAAIADIGVGVTTASPDTEELALMTLTTGEPAWPLCISWPDYAPRGKSCNQNCQPNRASVC